MTCDEFDQIIFTDPNEATKAEIMAARKHAKECNPCHNKLNEIADDAMEKLNLTPQQKLILSLEAYLIIRRTMNDPDYYE